MKRRNAIRHIGIISVGLLTIPACSIEAKLNTRFLDPSSYSFLQELIHQILPNSITVETPESTIDYVLNVIEYCSSPKEVNLFTKGLAGLQNQFPDKPFNIEYLETSYTAAKEQLELKTEGDQVTTEALVYTIETVKKLAIEHFTSSEYFQTKHLNYSFIPTPFQACVNI